MEDTKSIFQNNFRIMYEGLTSAINNYVESEYFCGNFVYIEAYLAATLHAAIDYAERYLEEDERVKAFKYANNTLKHNPRLVTHKEVSGGTEFPMEFSFCSEPINIIWHYDKTVATHSVKQMEAFENLFAGKPILETIKPTADLILSGTETKKAPQ